MTQPLYLIEASFGRLGRAFIETDRDQNSRAHVIDMIRSGEVKPVKVLEICEDDGICRNVTDDILAEAADGMCGHEVESLMADRFDHARDLRKHEVV